MLIDYFCSLHISSKVCNIVSLTAEFCVHCSHYSFKSVGISTNWSVKCKFNSILSSFKTAGIKTMSRHLWHDKRSLRDRGKTDGPVGDHEHCRF